MKKITLSMALVFVAAATPAVSADNGFSIDGGLGGSSLDIRDIAGADNLSM